MKLDLFKVSTISQPKFKSLKRDERNLDKEAEVCLNYGQQLTPTKIPIAPQRR